MAASDITCGALLPDDKFVMGYYGSFRTSGAIEVRDLETGSTILGPLYESEFPGPVWCVAYSAACGRIASSTETGVTLWDACSGQRVGGVQGIEFYSLCFSSDGRYLAGGCHTTIRLMPLDADLLSLPALVGHEGPICSVVFSPDDTLLVSAGADRTIRVWSTETQEALHVLNGHTNIIMSLDFSPMGKYVVSGSRDRTVRIWDVDMGRPVGVPLEGHTDDIQRVAFMPDGTRVVSASIDTTIRIWDRMPTIAFADRDAARKPGGSAPALPLQPPSTSVAADAGATLPANGPIPPSDGAAPNVPSGSDLTLPTGTGNEPRPADQQTPLPVADASAGPRPLVDPVPQVDGAAPHLPSDTGPTLLTETGDVPQIPEGQQTSPPIADQPASDARTEQELAQPHATVDKVPGCEGPDTHGDAPSHASAQTTHVEAAGDVAHGDGDAAARGEAEARDALAQDTAVAPSSGDALKELDLPFGSAAPNAASPTLLTASGNDPQRAEGQLTSPPADRPAAHGLAEQEREPHATADEEQDAQGDGPIQTSHAKATVDAANEEGKAKVGVDAVSQDTTLTVEHSAEDAKA